jgi:hypothetical protein
MLQATLFEPLFCTHAPGVPEDPALEDLAAVTELSHGTQWRA